MGEFDKITIAELSEELVCPCYEITLPATLRGMKGLTELSRVIRVQASENHDLSNKLLSSEVVLRAFNRRLDDTDDVLLSIKANGIERNGEQIPLARDLLDKQALDIAAHFIVPQEIRTQLMNMSNYRNIYDLSGWIGYIQVYDNSDNAIQFDGDSHYAYLEPDKGTYRDRLSGLVEVNFLG